MAMSDVTNFYDFFKSLKKASVPPKRMYGDMLPYVAVQHSREYSTEVTARNRSMQKASDRTVRSFYLRKRQVHIAMESEVEELYKKALQRFKVLKISQRRRRQEEKELLEAEKKRSAAKKSSTLSSATTLTGSQYSMVRRSSVLEVAKPTQSGLGFRRKERTEHDYPLSEPSSSGLVSPLKFDAIPKSPLLESQSAKSEKPGKDIVLPILAPPGSSPPKLKSPEKDQRRVKSTLHSIPEEGLRTQRGKLPPLTAGDRSSKLNYSKPWRNNAGKPEKREVTPLVSTRSRFVDWNLRDGEYQQTRKIFVEPKLRFFSYEPIIKIKNQLEDNNNTLKYVLSHRLHNFYKERSADATVTPTPEPPPFRSTFLTQRSISTLSVDSNRIRIFRNSPVIFFK